MSLAHSSAGRPIWAEISLSRLRANYSALRQAAHRSVASLHSPDPAAPPPIPLLAVVKANAYGHGVELCGPALAAAGAPWLGVTSVEEGVRLRRALGILPAPLAQTPILVMSGLWPGEAEGCLRHALTPQVWEPWQLELLHTAARAHGPRSVPVHLELDCGMARQGVRPGQPLRGLLAHPALQPGSPVWLEGVLTHFSAPERLDLPTTGQQLDCFEAGLAQVAAASHRPAWVHAGNSASVTEPPEAPARHLERLLQLNSRTPGGRLFMLPGLSLYGYPARFTPPAVHAPSLKPVLAWKTRITTVRDLAPGECAGYNSTFCATRPTRLALLPVGYADGLSRLLSNRGHMLVRGERAPIAGRISMDQTTLDVTGRAAAREAPSR